MSGQKYLACINRAGLGNRIKGLISAMRLSKITGRKLLLYWENNKYCGCDFNDLFENEVGEIKKNELKEIKKKNSKVYRDVLEADYDKYDYIILDTWKFLFLPGEVPEGFSKIYPSEKANNIDFEFNRIPEEVRGKLMGELFSLNPKKEIIDFVDKFSKENNIENCIGLHIRRGDNRFTVDGREKISSDDKFIEIINKNPEEKFFLSTDGGDTKKEFKDKFGEKIITFPESNLKRAHKESIIQAFEEMLILSRTKHIFGSYLSTFSELSWWFGGCKAKIEVVGADTVREKPNPETFLQKLLRKIKFYEVNFLRWIFRTYG